MAFLTLRNRGVSKCIQILGPTAAFFLCGYGLFALVSHVTYVEPFRVSGDYSYPIDLEDLPCGKPNMELLAVVVSAPQHFLERDIIRRTWGRAMKRSETMNVIFFLGQSFNETLEEQVLEESEWHEDIVQGDFHDTYRNLSLKGLFFMEWTRRNCSHVKWVLKVDDDMMVNPYAIQTYLKRKRHKDKYIHCSVMKNASVIRNETSKWYTTLEEYPDKFYKPYCQGPAYFLSKVTIEALLTVQRNSQRPPYVWEDYYFTGMLASEAKIKRMIINSKYRIYYSTNLNTKIMFAGTEGLNQTVLYDKSLWMWGKMTNDSQHIQI